MCGRNRGPGRCACRNGSPFGRGPRRGLVGMLVRHVIEKREASRALAQQPYGYKQQPYTHEPMPVAVSRKSLEKREVLAQGQGQRDWVAEKEALDLAEAIRLSREMAGVVDTESLPTYRQVMKEV